MGRIDIDQLCQDFEDCIGWPYKTPGTDDENGIDCSGMFVRAYKLQGARIYHGSNTIWRKHLAEKGEIKRAADLQKGMAVFKWLATGDPQKDGLGNFSHIGLVTGVRPLRIVHASTQGKRVVIADTKIGKWKYWGRLAEADYTGTPTPAQTMPTQQTQPTTSTPMGQPTLRRGHKGADVQRLQGLLVAAGCVLELDGVFGKQTLAAVKFFQSIHGLTVDGVVGRQTWTALLARQQEYLL